MLRSVLFLASASSDGNTRAVCEYISREFDLPILDFNNFEIDYYSYTKSADRDDFLALVEQLLKYDTLVFATPVYWYAMSAQMKTFFDRLTDLLKSHKPLGRQLRGKNMKVICCSSDETEYPEFWIPFVRSAEYLGMHYLGQAHTWTHNNRSLSESVKLRLKQLMQ